MRIGIEASRANRAEKTGVEWYAYHLIQALKELTAAEDHAWFLYGNTPFTAGLERGPANWHERRLAWSPTYLWTQARLSWELWRRCPDVLFVPAHVLPRVIPSRSVVTIHDVGFYRHPELYKKVQRIWHPLVTKDVVRRASRIITVSEYSKQELIHFCDVDPDRIFVTYPGVEQPQSPEPLSEELIASVLDRLNLPRPFFLYVGRLEAKKNLLTLIEGFRRYKTDHGLGDPLQLVLAGIKGNDFSLIDQAIRRSGLSEAIHLTGYISQTDKQVLCTCATALIHPSWYEGFGFTPLEAMAGGCPVICSRAGSLPEVVGTQNALFFDPSDAEGLARLMDRLVQDEPLQNTLRQKGLGWVSRYTWQETARRTLDILTRWE